MCNQAVSLIAAELERHGIATVALQLLRWITERVRPPRALMLPFKHGYPLGRPGDAALQLDVLEAALRLFEHPGPPPVLEDYVPAAHPPTRLAWPGQSARRANKTDPRA